MKKRFIRSEEISQSLLFKRNFKHLAMSKCMSLFLPLKGNGPSAMKRPLSVLFKIISIETRSDVYYYFLIKYNFKNAYVGELDQRMLKK